MHIDLYVHADMKPNNVLMDAGSKSPVIIDFGQACRLMTEKERVQGTPGYIAPEQVKRQKVTYLTDVFNWGATMYHLLSGRKIDTEKFTETPALTDVPTSLSDLILHCVQLEPTDRPTMKEVRDSLSRILPETQQPLKNSDQIDGER
jgi:serine/threonine-protein kinase